MPRPYPAGALIETFEIHATGPAGNVLLGQVHQGHSRDSARIIRVLDGPTAIYECESYDIGNAADRLDWWLAAQPFVPIPAVFADRFDRGEFTPTFFPDGKPQSIEGVYYARWKAERDAAGACDVCGEPVGADYQRTAESVVCGGCIDKSRAREAKQRAADETLHDFGGEGG